MITLIRKQSNCHDGLEERERMVSCESEVGMKSEEYDLGIS